MLVPLMRRHFALGLGQARWLLATSAARYLGLLLLDSPSLCCAALHICQG